MFKQNRVPTHPGVLLNTFLTGRSRSEVAGSLRITEEELDAIYDGQRPVTPELSDRLDTELKTHPGFWLKLQESWDAWECSVAR